MDYEKRRQKLQRKVKSLGADGLLVTDFTNVTYLTGFTGDDSYLLVRHDGETLLSDGRYTTQIANECPGLDAECRLPGTQMYELLNRVISKCKIGRLAIEADSMTVAMQEKLGKELPKVELVSSTGLVGELRMRKDREEIERIRAAVDVAQRAFAAVRATVRGDQTEKEVADELEHQMRRLGARAASFPSIVASGPRAALPHAVPQDVPIGRDGLLLIDWGAQHQLYASDLTRVLMLDKISAKMRRAYDVVLRAQRRAIEAIRPGAATKDVDQVARDTICDAKLGRYFGHGLGHGIGLQVHEGPRMSTASEGELKAGMVITVEPGVYMPDLGGIRLEDDVLVTRDGCEVLTSVPKEFDEMII